MMDNRFNANGAIRRAPSAVASPEAVAVTTMSAITNAGQGKSYSSVSHGNLVVEGFQRLWQESLMCDTQLIVQGQTFHVHRCYLAACSQYFFSMFTKDFAEKMQAQVELKGVTALGLRALLDYSYTGSICINDANLQDVLEAADHLQFNEILSFCAQHLKDELTSENCLHFLRMAETYGLQECKRDTKAFILENFQSVSQNDDFRYISFDLLCELLSDDRLRAHNEMEVFKIALNWLEIQSSNNINNTGAYNNNNNNNSTTTINNNSNSVASTCSKGVVVGSDDSSSSSSGGGGGSSSSSGGGGSSSSSSGGGGGGSSNSGGGGGSKQQELQRKVLSLIRFGLMTVEEVEFIYSHPVLRGEHCREVLHTGLSYHMKLFSQPITATTQVSRMRAYHDCLVILGAGYLDNTLCTNIMAAQIKDGALGQFVSLTQTRDRRYFAAVAVVNDFVFTVGGQTAMAGDGSHATNNAFRFNPRDGKWLQISSMSVPRTHFSLIALPNCLVAVGGKHNRVALNTAERYDFTSNEWTSISNLPHTLFSHAGCAHQSKVFISGGCPGEDFTDDVLCYDMDRRGWVQKAPLNQSRGYHVMVAHANKLYVCAGNTNAGDRHDVTMTECYDVDTDEWTVLSCSSQGQSEAPAVKCDGKVFILGGYSWDAHSFQESAQCYDIESDSWRLLENKLPEPMTGVVACRVKLPQKLFDEYPPPPPPQATSATSN